MENEKVLTIVDYSEKCIVVTGDTKTHKDTLKRLGGKFNRMLRCGAGWVFSLKRADEVRDFVKKVNDNL